MLDTLPFSLWDSVIKKTRVVAGEIYVAVLLMRFLDYIAALKQYERWLLPFSLWDSELQQWVTNEETSLPFSLWDSCNQHLPLELRVTCVAVLLMRFLKDARCFLIRHKLPFSLWDSKGGRGKTAWDTEALRCRSPYEIPFVPLILIKLLI